ncbi:hypothetical protein K456DRAFT_1879109 [Colletotrichum gloeosporioides 23]|nr:hypothetical protein K456DRAFT_1879109 [Colletotrichum gloeosporioides 23]
MDILKIFCCLRRSSEVHDAPDSPLASRRSSACVNQQAADTDNAATEVEGDRESTAENSKAEEECIAALVKWKSDVDRQDNMPDMVGDYIKALKDAMSNREHKSKTLKFAQHTRPIYDFASNFTPVAGAASEFSPVPFSPILGGAMCILSIVVKVDDYQTKMVDLLDEMITQLDLLEDYKKESLFEYDEKVEALQLQVTTHILEFCAEAAAALFNEEGKMKGTWRHVLKVQVKGFDQTFSSFQAQFLRDLKTLRDQRQFQERRNTRLKFQVLENDGKERKIAEIGERKVKEQKEAEERRKIVSGWLPFVSFTEIQDTNYTNRLDGTGDWLMEHNTQFQTWRQGVKPAKLWIHGKAGSGKSYLAARVINDLKQDIRGKETGNSAIAYAYCSSTKLHIQLTYNRLLGSLLRQLYSQLAPNKSLTSLESRAASQSPQGEGATRSELKEWIQAAIALLPSCFIVIDGLDECHLLEAVEFNDLCRFIASLALPKDHSLGAKVIVFSRPEYRDIDKALSLSDFAQISVDRGANDADMTLFITTKIDKIDLKKSQDHRRKEIKSTLQEQAGGMFLWVDLKIKDLQQCHNASDMQKALETAPDDLYGLYRGFMRRIPKHEHKYALKALLWLANSHTSLSKPELLEALVVENGTSGLTDESRLSSEVPLCIMCADLLIEEGNYYQLIHGSLKDFLLEKEMSSGIVEYDDLQKNAHFILARTCLTYLKFDHFRGVPSDTSDEVSQVLRDYPLLGYAAQWWGDHFSATSGSRDNLIPLSKTLLETPSAIDLSIKIFGFKQLSNVSFREHKEPSALHLLSIFNLRGLAQHLPSLQKSVNQRDYFHHFPIDYAMIYGSKEMAVWILHVYKENPDEFSACLQNCRVHLLALAAEKNWEDVVTSLVNMGFNKDLHTPGHPYTAVYVATTSRAHTALKRLLDLGADPNVGTTSETSPILSAAVAGDLDAVQLLLAAKIKANTEIRDANSLSILHHAVRCNSELSLKVTSQLLDRGVDVDTTTSEKDGRFTPLCEAAWNGSAQLAELLLSRGANLHHMTRDAENPMIIALKRENRGVLDVLIKHGADQAWVFDVNHGINLLHQAFHLNDTHLVHSLLTYNKDISFIDGEENDGKTPFYLAMEKKSITHCLELIRVGATKYLKKWPEELPAGFFTQLHQQYQHHARPELHSSSLESLLLSLATESPNLKLLESNENLDGMSEVLEIDGPDVGSLGLAKLSQGSSQANIGQAIICKLETIYNELLRLHRENLNPRAVRKKAWTITDACYFSHSILNEPHDEAFIDGATYDKITRFDDEILTLQQAPTRGDGTIGPVDSRLKSDGVPSPDVDDDEVSKNDSICGGDYTQDVHPKESTAAVNTGTKDEKAPTHDTEVEAPAKKRDEMWTEITRDLVIEEAIQELGYDYERTEHFFYIMHFLKYDDVLELVVVSDNIRRKLFNPRGSTLERHYLGE